MSVLLASKGFKSKSVFTNRVKSID